MQQRDLDVLRIDPGARAGRRSRWIWAALVVVALLLIAAGVVWRLPATRATVRVATVHESHDAASSATVLNASGYVTARRRATVSSKITGKLVDVRVEEGMAVEADQILARLDDTQFRALVAVARARQDAARRAGEETAARLQLAEVTLRRARRLVADGVDDQASLDRAETEVVALRARQALDAGQIRVAERELALRETELADTVIRAPFAGVVISKDAQPGEMVSPVSAGGGFTRTGICTIVDMGSLEIEVDVNESYISRVLPDQPVEAVLDAYPEWRLPARVITTIPTADRQKATVLVRIAFDELDARILPDMGVSVAFQETEAAADEARRTRLTVPRAALRRNEGRDVVFVVRDGRVERRAVSTGTARADAVEVLSGIAPGEQVVVEPPPDLADGDRVKLR